MKALFAIVALLTLTPASTPQQCPQDLSRFTDAKATIAKRVVEQSKARLETCQHQPKPKQALCAEWADAGNQAANDIMATAFAEIDKLSKP